MLTCTAALSWMRHDRDGAVLDLGRRRRRPNTALRRAARERDKCRCRFPGCESRRVDLHHIQHRINGGRTSLHNLISLCPYHHARTPQERREQRDQADDPELFRPTQWVIEPADWIGYIHDHSAA